MVGSFLAATTACGSAQPDLATPAPDAPSIESPVGTSEAQVGAEAGSVRGEAPTDDDQEESPLSGVAWQWVRFVDPLAGAIDVPEPERYTLTFDEGVVQIHADCKEGQGAYMVDRNELIVRILRTSEDDCGEASLADEFIDNVNSASSFEVVGGELVVSLRWDTGTMRFAPGDEMDDAASDEPPGQDAAATERPPRPRPAPPPRR